MIREIAINHPNEEPVKIPGVKKKGNLKQRAYLNTLSGMIDYAGAQITGMIVSPFIVSGLGSSMYGIWQILTQMTGYAKMTDARASQVLKWTVAKKQDTAGAEELRSDVTSAFVVTVMILPLVMITGGIISWYAPYITHTDPAYYNLVRITCSLLILSLTISKVFDLFEAVLRGMNLDYKRMGLRASIIICGGALKVLVITHGFGLVGLSLVQILITLITGISFYFIVKRSVGWFGFGKTNYRKVVDFSKLSGWNMANTASEILLSHSDKVLLGFVAGPVLVSSYALTTFLPLAIQGLIFRVIIGAIPGIGKLLGLQEYSKIGKVWGNINDFIFLLTTASGVTIILFNHSFLQAWVGEGHYAGSITNALVMLMVIQDTFIKHDGYIITASLDLKKKVFLTLRSAVIFLGLGFLFIHFFGIAGLCISLIVGKFILFVNQRNVLQKKVQLNFNTPYFKRIQPLLVSLVLLGGAFGLSVFMQPVRFMEMLILAPCTFILSFLIYYRLGLRKEKREDLLQVITSIKFLKSN